MQFDVEVKVNDSWVYSVQWLVQYGAISRDEHGIDLVLLFCAEGLVDFDLVGVPLL